MLIKHSEIASTTQYFVNIYDIVKFLSKKKEKDNNNKIKLVIDSKIQNVLSTTLQYCLVDIKCSYSTLKLFFKIINLSCT